MEQSLIFFSLKNCLLRNLHEIQFLISRETEEGAKVVLSNCCLSQGRDFKDPMNPSVGNQNSIFSHYSKIVSDYLLLHTAE